MLRRVRRLLGPSSTGSDEGLRWAERGVRSGDELSRRFASFGDGTEIEGPFEVFGSPTSITIGADTLIRGRTKLEALAPLDQIILSIGSRCHLSFGIRIVAVNGVELADDVGIGDNTFIADTMHDYRNYDGPVPWHAPLKLGGPLRIERGVWIGVNCAITGGITIGEGSVIAPCTPLNRSVPPHTLVGGNPARIWKRRNDAGTWEWVADPDTLGLGPAIATVEP